MAISRNCLHYYVELIRMPENAKNTTYKSRTENKALHNIIRTMRASRHEMICGEDFSRLDFGNIPLNGIKWSESGDNPCSFRESRLNEWNFVSGHSDIVTSVAWAKSGKYVLTNSADGTSILWNPQDGCMLQKYYAKVSLSSGDKDEYCISASSNGEVTLWPITVAKKKVYFTESNIEYVAFYDDKYILTKSDVAITIWNFKNGKKITSFKLRDFLSSYIWSISLHESSVDIALYYSMETEDTMKVGVFNLDIATEVKKEIPCYSLPLTIEYISDDSEAFEIKDEILINSDTAVRNSFNRGFGLRVIHKWGNAGVIPFALSTNLFLTNDGIWPYAKLWDADMGKCLKTLKGHTGTVTSVDFSNDGKYCITGSEDGSAIIWDVDSGKCVNKLGGYTRKIIDVSLSICNKMILVPSYSEDDNDVIFNLIQKRYIEDIDDTILEKCFTSYCQDSPKYSLYDPGEYSPDYLHPEVIEKASGKVKQVLLGHSEEILSYAFTKDEKYCLTGSADRTARLWNIESGECIYVFDDCGYYKVVNYVTFVDETKCVTGYPGYEMMWNIQTGKPISSPFFPKLKGKKVLWRFPYYFDIDYYRIHIWKYDFSDSMKAPLFIDTMYILRGLHLNNCDFQGVYGTDAVKKIIHQYSGL